VRLARLSKDPAGSRHSGTAFGYIQYYARLIVAVRISSRDGLATFRPVWSPPTTTPAGHFFRRCCILYSSSYSSPLPSTPPPPPAIASAITTPTALRHPARVFNHRSSLFSFGNCDLSFFFFTHECFHFTVYYQRGIIPLLNAAEDFNTFEYTAVEAPRRRFFKTYPLRGYSSDECVVMTDLLRAFNKNNEIMKCRCIFKYYKDLSGGHRMHKISL